MLSHTRMGVPYDIRIWDVPYEYEPIYAHGAEHLHDTHQGSHEWLSVARGPSVAKGTSCGTVWL